MKALYRLDLLPVRQRRAIALGLAAVGVLGVALIAWQMLVAPRLAMEADLDRREALYARLAAVAAFKEREGENALPRLSEDVTALFLPERDEALLSAELRGLVTERVAAATARLDSTTELPRRTEEGLDWIGVQARVEGSLRDIQDLLVRLEGGTPAMRVTRLDLEGSRETLDTTRIEGPEMAAVIDVYAPVLAGAPR